MSTVAQLVLPVRCSRLGHAATAHIERVDDEIARRAEHGLQAVTDRELLRVLFTLPADYPVPRHDLDARQFGRLRRAPAGVCDLDRQDVTRRLVPAIRVHGVTVTAAPTLSQLRAASVLAPFAQLTLQLTGTDAPYELVERAAHLGIGLISPHGRLLLAPRPFRPQRHTPARWLFLERTFDAVIHPGNHAA